MEEVKNYKKELSFSTLAVSVTRLGDDCQMTVWGGEKPHIGCILLTVPRPSLKGDGQAGCTTSVINVTGHKDEQICRILAEKAAKKYNAIVSCSGGFHIDNITRKQIEEVVEAARQIAEEI